MAPQPEPPEFDVLVRKPGNAHVLKQKASGQPLRFDPFWGRIYDHFHAAYGGRCAYTCFYQPERATIDHFRPKQDFPELAYEWSNYRLCSPRTNQFKGRRSDLLDPFLITRRLFVLNLRGCLIQAADGLEIDLRDAVQRTITALRLNDDDYLVQRRIELIAAFAEGHVTQEYVGMMNPFIFDEITRQGLWDSINSLFGQRRR